MTPPRPRRGHSAGRRRSRDVDMPRRRVATPRPRRGYAAETSRGGAAATTWIFRGRRARVSQVLRGAAARSRGDAVLSSVRRGAPSAARRRRRELQVSPGGEAPYKRPVTITTYSGSVSPSEERCRPLVRRPRSGVLKVQEVRSRVRSGLVPAVPQNSYTNGGGGGARGASPVLLL